MFGVNMRRRPFKQARRTHNRAHSISVRTERHAHLTGISVGDSQRW
jgi:hypothetical protein